MYLDFKLQQSPRNHVPNKIVEAHKSPFLVKVDYLCVHS